MRNFTVSIPDLSAGDMMRFIRLQESCALVSRALLDISLLFGNDDPICKLGPYAMGPIFQWLCLHGDDDEDDWCNFNFLRDENGEVYPTIYSDEYKERFGNAFQNDTRYYEKKAAWNNSLMQLMGEIWDEPADDFEW